MWKYIALLVVIVALVLSIGYVIREAKPLAIPNPFAQVAQSDGGSNINVDACVGPKSYCEELARQKALEEANRHDEWLLANPTAMPAPTPTEPPVWVGKNQQKRDTALTNMMTAAGIVILSLLVIGGLGYLLLRIYRYYRVDIPKIEVEPHGKKVGNLTAIRLPANLDLYESRDTFIVVDNNALGTQMLFIDGKGLFHQVAQTDNVGSTVAISHAMMSSINSAKAGKTLQQFLKDWNKAADQHMLSAGEAAAKWRKAGKSIQKTEPPVPPETPAKRFMTRRRH